MTVDVEAITSGKRASRYRHDCILFGTKLSQRIMQRRSDNNCISSCFKGQLNTAKCGHCRGKNPDGNAVLAAHRKSSYGTHLDGLGGIDKERIYRQTMDIGNAIIRIKSNTAVLKSTQRKKRREGRDAAAASNYLTFIIIFLEMCL